MTLGQKLYNLRKKRGISQEELAHSINVSRQAISKWEQDSVVIDTQNLINICNFFGVTLDYMVNDNEAKENTGVVKKTIDTNIAITISGLVLLLISFIFTYFMKISEFYIYGRCFDNALDYLFVFPINILFSIAVLLSLVGLVKIFLRRKHLQK